MKAKKIIDGFNSIDDLIDYIKPFIEEQFYNIKDSTINGEPLANSVYSVLIKKYNSKYKDEHRYKRLILFNITPKENIDFSKINFNEYNYQYEDYLKSPLKIQISIGNYYYKDIPYKEDEEDEEDAEYEEKEYGEEERQRRRRQVIQQRRQNLNFD